MNKKLIVSLLGAPGSGKGTQSSNILHDYDFGYLCVGDKLREVMNEDPKMKAILASGQLLDSNYVNSLVDLELNKIQEDIILLDGYPRKLDQAEHLKLNYEILVIYLKLDNETIIKRLKVRAYCNQCKEILSQSTKCVKCGSVDISQREDDSISTIHNRLREFEEFTKSLIEYYEPVINVVDASKSITEVYLNIKQILDSKLNF